VLGCGLPGATATATGTGEASLWVAGVLGTAFQVWAPGEQFNNAAGMGEPRLWIVGALGPAY
jgi:hypothetical protein